MSEAPSAARQPAASSPPSPDQVTLPYADTSGLSRFAAHSVFFCAFAFKIVRAGMENSWWIDEAYSAMLATHTFRNNFELLAVDSHPPLYHMVFKAWVAIGRRIMPDAMALLWGRSLNWIPWAVMLCAAAWIGRRVAGRGAMGLMLAAVAACGGVAKATHDMRAYGFAGCGALLAFMFLLFGWGRAWGAWSANDGTPNPRRRGLDLDGDLLRTPILLWGAYAASLSLAMWSHPLGNVLALAMGLLWVALAATAWLRHAPGRLAFLKGGVLGHTAAIIAFLPWALLLRHQIEFNRDPERWTWIPTPTLRDLIEVFAYWYPLGSVLSGGAGLHFTTPVKLFGGAIVALPVLAAAWVAWQRRGGPPRTLPDRPTRAAAAAGSPPIDMLAATALLGLAVSALYVLLLYGIHQSKLLHVFYAPRYPLHAAPIFAVAIGACALLAGRGNRWRAWGFAAPWMIGCLAGQVGCLVAERTYVDAPERAVADLKGLLPPQGQPLYVLHEEFLRYLPQSLQRFETRPIGELVTRLNKLPETPEGREELPKNLSILDLNRWAEIRHPREFATRTRLLKPANATRILDIPFPRGWAENHLYYLENVNWEELAENFADGLEPRPSWPRPGALAMLLPGDLLPRDGWCTAEVDNEFRMFRWAGTDRARLRFRAELPPGRYVVRIMGFSPPEAAGPAPAPATPPAPVTLRVRSKTIDGRILYEEKQPIGGFVIEFPVKYTKGARNPEFFVEHPRWSPKQLGESSDGRTLSWLFNEAWIEPAEARGAAPATP